MAGVVVGGGDPARLVRDPDPRRHPAGSAPSAPAPPGRPVIRAQSRGAGVGAPASTWPSSQRPRPPGRWPAPVRWWCCSCPGRRRGCPGRPGAPPSPSAPSAPMVAAPSAPTSSMRRFVARLDERTIMRRASSTRLTVRPDQPVQGPLAVVLRVSSYRAPVRDAGERGDHVHGIVQGEPPLRHLSVQLHQHRDLHGAGGVHDHVVVDGRWRRAARGRPVPHVGLRAVGAAAKHLAHQRLVAVVESAQLPLPAERLGMGPVAGLVQRQDVPESVQLPVLTQEVASAEQRRVHVPDPHAFTPRAPRRRESGPPGRTPPRTPDRPGGRAGRGSVDPPGRTPWTRR
jgi:hypothetical protein